MLLLLIFFVMQVQGNVVYYRMAWQPYGIHFISFYIIVCVVMCISNYIHVYFVSIHIILYKERERDVDIDDSELSFCVQGQHLTMGVIHQICSSYAKRKPAQKRAGGKCPASSLGCQRDSGKNRPQC